MIESLGTLIFTISEQLEDTSALGLQRNSIVSCIRELISGRVQPLVSGAFNIRICSKKVLFTTSYAFF